VQFDKEASQTRDYCVAQNAMRRAARPDSSLRKERLLGMTSKTSPPLQKPRPCLCKKRRGKNGVPLLSHPHLSKGTGEFIVTFYGVVAATPVPLTVKVAEGVVLPPALLAGTVTVAL
jgi:hypothetical protein